ncbi:beta-ketoacyl synthase chain length factor [Acidiferrobacter sp.]|uniref:beta-ketoacyl synthase chain length factor n=1 Tax=Acidiferrobacter sp. TaxID=1872107 RepID=UPI0026381397|nr:beta-ketoacyl synthase chain length factor [Acidiferrobacter sp.]
MTTYIAGWGVLGPGLPDARAARAVLLGERPYRDEGVRPPVVEGLSANEARRCPTSARYALDVGWQALRDAGWDPAGVVTVLASASGDLEIADKNCQALARSEIALSPTLFHNSVHNAAGGYWGIATASQASTTSLSAYDASFAAGLLEALTTVAPGRRCLLMAYDFPAPAAFAAARRISAPFAVALALTADRPAGPCASLSWQWTRCDQAVVFAGMTDAALEALRVGNSAARSLPLLQGLSERRATTLSWADAADMDWGLCVTLSFAP